MGFLDNPLSLLYFIPIFLITITIHEYSHAYVAYRLGDRTAAAMGRLSLNPLKHLDPFGFIMLMIIGFGWAKPVPIYAKNFKNPKAGMAISALAGPVSNLLMAFIGTIIYFTMLLIAHKTQNYGAVMTSAVSFFSYFATLNVWFAVFNFIPVPPLDGSRIVNYFLPPRLSYYYSYVERYGFIILIVLLNADRFIGVSILRGPMQYVASLIITGMHIILTPIFNLFV